MESSSESNHLSLPPYSVSLAIFHLYDIDCNPSAPPLNIACGVWPQSQRQSDVENALTYESRPFCGNNTGGELAYKILEALFGQLVKFYEVFHIYGYEDHETSGAVCALWSSATFVV